MKRIALFGMCVLLPIFGGAEEQVPAPTPMTTMTARQVLARDVNVKIESLTEEQTKTGLTIEDLRDAIIKPLQDADITVNGTIAQPILVLRVRTISLGLDMASFFQLSLLEEAMLLRNRAIFAAPTWSQASLLSCRPEDLKKEAVASVSEMSKAFAKDFIRAYQPAGK